MNLGETLTLHFRVQVIHCNTFYRKTRKMIGVLPHVLKAGFTSHWQLDNDLTSHSNFSHHPFFPAHWCFVLILFCSEFWWCQTARLLSPYCVMWFCSKGRVIFCLLETVTTPFAVLQIRFLYWEKYVQLEIMWLESRLICHLLIKINMSVFRWWLVLIFHSASSIQIFSLILSIFLCLPD